MLTVSLKDEAIKTYTELNSARSYLVEDRRSDGTVQPPFFWHHIDRECQRWAILKTWQNARIGSVQRQLFDKGATHEEYGLNWVILWLLYSVFRSRDTRNNRNRRNGGSNDNRNNNDGSGMT